jgi:hypothetical protein
MFERLAELPLVLGDQRFAGGEIVHVLCKSHGERRDKHNRLSTRQVGLEA